MSTDWTLLRRRFALLGLYLLSNGCMVRATSQPTSSSPQEPPSIDSHESSNISNVAEPIRVIRGIGEGCTVDWKSIEQLAAWLTVQFRPGESLDTIKKKMKSRGKFLKTTCWGGTGTQDADFITDQGLTVCFIIDRFDHLLSDSSIEIRCGSRIGAEKVPQTIHEWTTGIPEK